MGSPSKYIDPSLALALLRSVRAALRMTLLKKIVAMKKLIRTNLQHAASKQKFTV